MGLKSTVGVPHKGWTLTDVIDLHLEEGLDFGDYEDCEFCDHEQIRFVHKLIHPNYRQEMRVGCVCAEILTEDYVTPKIRERELRNKAARRDRFPNRKWKTTKLGGKSLKLDGHRVTIGKKSGMFRIWINGNEGKRNFTDERKAMLHAYDYIQKIGPQED